MEPLRSIRSKLHSQLVFFPLLDCAQHGREIIRRLLEFQNMQGPILVIENLYGSLAAFALEKAEKNSCIGLKLNRRLHGTFEQHLKLMSGRVVAINENF